MLGDLRRLVCPWTKRVCLLQSRSVLKPWNSSSSLQHKTVPKQNKHGRTKGCWNQGAHGAYINCFSVLPCLWRSLHVFFPSTKELRCLQLLLPSLKGLLSVFGDRGGGSLVLLILFWMVLPATKLPHVQQANLFRVAPGNVTLRSFTVVVSHPPPSCPGLRWVLHENQKQNKTEPPYICRNVPATIVVECQLWWRRRWTWEDS